MIVIIGKLSYNEKNLMVCRKVSTYWWWCSCFVDFTEIIRHLWCCCTDRLPGRISKNKTCQQRMVR